MGRNNRTALLIVALCAILLIGYLLLVPGDSGTRSKKAVLEASGSDFSLRGKRFRILSGAMHYFRIVPDYWEHRLMKLKAAGLNTVETYMPWNLHEPVPGRFDFSGMLDVVEYVRLAQRLGLHVIVRPGPYICAEWDMGGLPAWLLHDPAMRVRSMYEPYLVAVERYFRQVFKLLVPLQASSGGPIVAFQIENEFTHYVNATSKEGKRYLNHLYKLMRSLGLVELLFTSDGQYSMKNAASLLPKDVLITVNFQKHAEAAIDSVRAAQPDKPAVVMEFWTGWFDHWGQPHEVGLTASQFETAVDAILRRGASINLYMFHGGTNFGFMNGANVVDGEYQPTVTSYDYNAPLSEAGDTTPKYTALKHLLQERVPEFLSPSLPPVPADLQKMDYGEAHMTLYIPITSTLPYLPFHEADLPMPMESLPVNENSGQAYGFVLYRTLVPSSAKEVSITQLKDLGLAMVNSKPVKRLSGISKQSFMLSDVHSETGQSVLDIIVENCGRVNYGGTVIQDRKGILGAVMVDGEVQKNWKIYSLEFKMQYLQSMESGGGNWFRTSAGLSPSTIGPALFQGSFVIQDEPCDTFADMEGWERGVLFINGANLGRYSSKGPQRTLYVPAPVLKKGVNKVMIFELFFPRKSYSITFRNSPLLFVDDTTT